MKPIPSMAQPLELTAQQVAPLVAQRSAPLVVKIGGALLEAAAQHASAFAGILALHRSHAGGVILVHGGGAQVDRQLARMGIETPRIEGIRVTTAEAIDQVVGVLAGSAHLRLMGVLKAQGANCVGLSLCDGGLCECRHTTKYAFDAGEVGEITGGDATVIRGLLALGCLPVVNSIGLSASGEPLNINADEAACAIARVTHAAGLVLLTDVAGVLDAHGTLIDELDAPAIERLIAKGTVSGGMIPKVRNALEAATLAGCPATIASWRAPAAALTRGGGTRILANATPSTTAPLPTC